MSMLLSVDSESSAQPDVQSKVFSFIVHLLENDLSTLHLQIAYTSIRDSSLALQEYIQVNISVHLFKIG